MSRAGQCADGINEAGWEREMAKPIPVPAPVVTGDAIAINHMITLFGFHGPVQEIHGLTMRQAWAYASAGWEIRYPCHECGGNGKDENGFCGECHGDGLNDGDA